MAFTALAREISKHCEVLDEFITNQKLEKPSFEDDGSLKAFINCIDSADPDQVPNLGRVREARTRILDQTADLRDLVLGPAAMIVWPALTYPYQLSTLKMLNDFSIPEAIPDKGSAGFCEIARRRSLHVDFVERLIRHASTFHIFTIDEKSKMVSHSAASQAFLSHPSLRDTLKICLDMRFLHTAFQIGDAVKEYHTIFEPTKTAFNIAFDTKRDYLAYMIDSENFELCNTMLNHLNFVMAGHNMATRYHHQDALASIISASISSNGPELYSDSESGSDSEPKLTISATSTIVDMGGGWGHVCACIAKDHDKLQFVVKDLPAMVAGGQQMIDGIAHEVSDGSKRIKFETYDFIKGKNKPDNASVYMFRFVMHDWSDPYVIKILQNIVPSMDKGAHIMIMDYIVVDHGKCVPDSTSKKSESAIPLVVERLERTMDMAALSILAGKERTENDWRQLIETFNGLQPNDKLDIISIDICEGHAFGVVVLKKKEPAKEPEKKESKET